MSCERVWVRVCVRLECVCLVGKCRAWADVRQQEGGLDRLNLVGQRPPTPPLPPPTLKAHGGGGERSGFRAAHSCHSAATEAALGTVALTIREGGRGWGGGVEV